MLGDYDSLTGTLFRKITRECVPMVIGAKVHCNVKKSLTSGIVQLDRLLTHSRHEQFVYLVPAQRMGRIPQANQASCEIHGKCNLERNETKNIEAHKVLLVSRGLHPRS